MSREYYIFSEKDEVSTQKIVDSVVEKMNELSEAFDGFPSDLGEILDVRSMPTSFREGMIEDFNEWLETDLIELQKAGNHEFDIRPEIIKKVQKAMSGVDIEVPLLPGELFHAVIIQLMHELQPSVIRCFSQYLDESEFSKSAQAEGPIRTFSEILKDKLGS